MQRQEGAGDGRRQVNSYSRVASTCTVSDSLSEGYEKLLSHVIIFVKQSSSNEKVKAVMFSKNAIGTKFECDSMDPTVCYLTYQISGSSFMMTHQYETSFPQVQK